MASSPPHPVQRARSACAYGTSLTTPPDRPGESCDPQKSAHSLVDGALGLRDTPDRLLEGGAQLEWQAAAEAELAPSPRPGHAQRSPLVELRVVCQLGRH